MNTLRTGALSLLLLGSVSAPAYADRADTLLLLLKKKGIITEQEYTDLQAESAAAEQAKSSTTVTTNAPRPAPEAAAAALDNRRSVRMTESGVGFEMGGVQLKFSGSVNGFYVYDDGQKPGATTGVTGGLASVGKGTSSVRNGLLPGFLKIEVTTNQGGWDVGAHFGLYPGINSVSYIGGANSAGNPGALGTAGIDARQTYLTVGKPKLGEFKIGRDIGLFASEAILNDVTLLGVGTPAGNSAPSNTSLGRIGLGYLYTDFQPQVTYTSPKMGGFQLSVGAFQPLVTAGRSELNDTPGFQGKATYDFKADKLTGHVWVSGIVQDHDGGGIVRNYNGRGIDFGTKLGYAGFNLLGYYYTGTGLGTTGLFIFSTDASGRPRDSDGFYVQGGYTYKKFSLAGSYGESHLSLNKGEPITDLIKRNSSYVGQVRYGLTSWVNLVGEYIHTESRAQDGNKAESDAIALGSILFF